MIRTCLFLFAAALPAFAVHAAVHTETVEYRVEGTVFHGHLAHDDSTPGKRPAVLVVHEWWGQGDHARQSARDLAALGYVGFAVDMYGDARLTDDPAEAGQWAGAVRGNPERMRARFEAALNTLAADPRVDAARIAAIGYCFGGTVVLEMARAGLPLRGVVSFHGGLKSALPEAPRTIGASVLVLHGADDPLVPDEEVAAFQAEMRAAKADWQFVGYGNAVHSFTNPDVDRHGMAAAKYDPVAAKRAWGAMAQFLAEIFAR
jgi:dienelactone hydrolase